MDIGAISLAGAFLVGLAHVFQPCEDKAIVAVFVMGTARRVATAVPLVVLYGLGITLVNTMLGLVFSLAGSALVERYDLPLKLAAGAVTIFFGLYMLSRFRHLHLGHGHEEPQLLESNPKTPSAIHMLAFGLVRGLALCPVELAVLAWALSTGDVLRGTLILLMFGLGTTVSLVPVALLMGGVLTAARKTRYGDWLARVAPLAMVLIGIFLVIAAVTGIEV